MEILARDDYLVFLRHREYQIPISAAALEKYIFRFYGEFFEKYGLPTIPIFLFERSDHMRNSYGIFAHSDKDAVAIALNISLWDGLNMEQLTDILLHEGCHFHTWFFRGSATEAPDGHSAEFFRFCAEVGCRPEKSSTHKSIYVRDHIISPQLTDAKKAFLRGDVRAAKAIAWEESMYGDVLVNLPFQTFLEWYSDQPCNLLVSLDDLESYIIDEDNDADDKDARAVWSLLSYKAHQHEPVRWGFLMHLKEAARCGSTLGAYFYGKSLIEGECGLVPCHKKGLFYLERGVRKHMPSAMKLFIKTIRDMYGPGPSVEALARLVELDVGDPPLDLTPGGDVACFVPYL